MGHRPWGIRIAEAQTTESQGKGRRKQESQVQEFARRHVDCAGYVFRAMLQGQRCWGGKCDGKRFVQRSRML
jgi:hypothetical protein